MPHRIQNGLIDYLEIMQLSGVDTLGRGACRVEAENENAVDDSVPAEEDVPEVDTEVSEPFRKAPEPETELIEETDMKKSTALKKLAEEVATCSLCSELALTRTQTVFGVGNPDSELVFLGEAPGADEDKKGEPFVGRAGKLLDDIITKGMKLRREDVYICNILRCRPPGNRNPLPDEAANCRAFLDKTLKIIKPKFICCLGTVAAQNLLGTDQTIGSMRGKIFEYAGIKVVCTYHPAYLLRNPDAKKLTWDDLKLLMKEMGLSAK